MYFKQSPKDVVNFRFNTLSSTGLRMTNGMTKILEYTNEKKLKERYVLKLNSSLNVQWNELNF